MNIPDEILDRVLKLKALAERGVGGEKLNAEKFLKDLLEKHGLSIEDLLHDKPEYREFKYKTKREKSLIYQIIAHVIGKGELINNRRPAEFKGIIAADLTTSEFVECVEKITFYKKVYYEEEDLFYTAFIHKQRLFNKRDQNEGTEDDEAELTPAERAKMFRIAQMMQGIEKKGYIKSISQNAEG